MNSEPNTCVGCGHQYAVEDSDARNASNFCSSECEGDAKNVYLVTAVCTGTITETWRVTSENALTREELDDVICGHKLSKDDSVEVDCIHEATSDEENREVTAVECEHGELLADDEGDEKDDDEEDDAAPPAPSSDFWTVAEDRCTTCGTLLGVGIRALHLGLCEACRDGEVGR